jgi:hypothetical protein
VVSVVVGRAVCVVVVVNVPDHHAFVDTPLVRPRTRVSVTEERSACAMAHLPVATLLQEPDVVFGAWR